MISPGTGNPNTLNYNTSMSPAANTSNTTPQTPSNLSTPQTSASDPGQNLTTDAELQAALAQLAQFEAQSKIIAAQRQAEVDKKNTTETEKTVSIHNIDKTDAKIAMVVNNKVAINNKAALAANVEHDLQIRYKISTTNAQDTKIIEATRTTNIKNRTATIGELKDVLAAEKQGQQKGILHLTMGPGNALHDIRDLAVNNQIHSDVLQSAMLAVPTAKRDANNRPVFDLFLTKKQFAEMKPGQTLMHMVGGNPTHIAIGACHIIEDEDQFKNVLKQHYEEHFGLSFVSHASVGHRDGEKDDSVGKKRLRQEHHHVDAHDTEANKENALLKDAIELDKELHEAAQKENAQEIKDTAKSAAARTAFNDARRKQNENIEKQHEKVKTDARNVDDIVKDDEVAKRRKLNTE